MIAAFIDATKLNGSTVVMKSCVFSILIFPWRIVIGEIRKVALMVIFNPIESSPHLSSLDDKNLSLLLDSTTNDFPEDEKQQETLIEPPVPV